MNITVDSFDRWPAFEAFQAARPGWQAMNEPPTKVTTKHGTIYQAGYAPTVIYNGETSAGSLEFEIGCTSIGEPAVRCVQTGKVWVGDFVAMVLLAMRDGVAR